VHVVIDAAGSFLVGEMSLWGIYQIVLEFRITNERLKTWHYLPIVKCETLATHRDILAHKGWATR
jgi:hypothetical protein